MFDSENKIAKVKFAPNVVVAPDLPEKLISIQMRTSAAYRRKVQNTLDIVFLARIARMKNLDGALKMLHGVHGSIKFDIFGPLEDQAYWAECENIIRSLPSNIKVQHKGHVKRENVHAVMSDYHLFFLPTLGENFGHVILEALTAGCPILISDRTPWRGLEEKGVGWDIPLEEPERFKSILNQCVEMDQESLSVLSRQARVFAKEIANDENNLMLNRNLFLDA
jgi:glycosyltransferase involved in cell wall biosynthesis